MSEKLMIVDDSIFIYEEMKQMLKGTEFEIVGYAKHGEDAINQYASLQPDLVTMDIILPGMDGIEAAKIMRQKWPDARIIIVSSLAYDETMEEARLAGAVDFMFKPFEREDLLVTLRKAVNSQAEKV